jgi:hypothetical protein
MPRGISDPKALDALPPAERLAAMLRASLTYIPPQEGGREAHIDVFRFAMIRRIHTFMRIPLRCREPLCRRSKKCLGPSLRCQRDVPMRPVSEKRRADGLVFFRRKLEQAMERREAEARVDAAPATRRRPRSPRPAAPPSPAGR